MEYLFQFLDILVLAIFGLIFVGLILLVSCLPFILIGFIVFAVFISGDKEDNNGDKNT